MLPGHRGGAVEVFVSLQRTAAPCSDARRSTWPVQAESAFAVAGAGFAGMNALFVALQYLPRAARITLVERRYGPGGT